MEWAWTGQARILAAQPMHGTLEGAILAGERLAGDLDRPINVGPASDTWLAGMLEMALLYLTRAVADPDHRRTSPWALADARTDDARYLTRLVARLAGAQSPLARRPERWLAALGAHIESQVEGFDKRLTKSKNITDRIGSRNTAIAAEQIARCILASHGRCAVGSRRLAEDAGCLPGPYPGLADAVAGLDNRAGFGREVSPERAETPPRRQARLVCALGALTDWLDEATEPGPGDTRATGHARATTRRALTHPRVQRQLGRAFTSWRARHTRPGLAVALARAWDDLERAASRTDAGR